MTRYVLKRFSIAVVILLVMSSLLFVPSRTDDPRHRMLDEYTTAEQWKAWGEEFGLNRPLVVQYVDWIADSTRIDFGNSIERRIPARGIALEHTSETLRLLAGGLAFSVIFSGAAILVITYFGQRELDLDHIGRSARVIIPAIPPFIPGILLAHIFYSTFLLFPIVRDGIWGYVLPSTSLGMVLTYGVVRLFNAARENDSGSRPVAWPMLLNLLRSSRFYLPVFLAAVIFTELIFDMRGLSTLILGINPLNDFPLASSALMILAMAYVTAMLLMDVARAFVDPQVRYGSSDIPVTDSALVSSMRPVPSGEWPIFGQRPMVALTILGLIILLSVCVPFIVSYRGDATGTDWLFRIFVNIRNTLATLALALIAAAVVGVAAALTANRYGGVIDRLLVWFFDLCTALPILLLGFVGLVIWAYTTVIFSFLYSYIPLFIHYLTYPACLFAVIVSGMFFHRVRTDAKMALGQEGVFNRDVARGILMVAALNAGPIVMLGAIFDAAGGWGYGWGGPIGRTYYALTSIWWTLLAGLVLILTVLSLNFLGEWLREHFDPPPPPASPLSTHSEMSLQPERSGEPST